MKRILDCSQLNAVIDGLGKKKIVFTNGVFDIIHPGHIELFEFAKSQGDILIVGINTDDSVKRIKGKKRPVFPLLERVEILEAIETIDFIIPFSEDTPLQLIRCLNRIDVLIKGKDYLPSQVVGRQEIEDAGGRLVLFPYRSQYSTTAIIEKIRS